MRKLKILLSALVVIVSFASLFSVAGCKKTYTTVVQDSVFHSKWLALDMTLDVSTGDSVYYQDIVANKLSSKIVNGGVVVSYLGYPNGSGDTVSEAFAEFAPYVQQLFITNTIRVISYGGDISWNASTGDGFFFRYVLIPGNVVANSTLKGLTQNQLNKMKFTDIESAIKSAGQGSSSGQGNSLH